MKWCGGWIGMDRWMNLLWLMEVVDGVKTSRSMAWWVDGLGWVEMEWMDWYSSSLRVSFTITPLENIAQNLR